MITSMIIWCYHCSIMLFISATPTLRFSDGRTRQLCSLPSGDASTFQYSFFLLQFCSHTPFADLWYLSFSFLRIWHIRTFPDHDVYLCHLQVYQCNNCSQVAGSGCMALGAGLRSLPFFFPNLQPHFTLLCHLGSSLHFLPVQWCGWINMRDWLFIVAHKRYNWEKRNG